MIGVDVKGADELQRKLHELAYAGASRASRKGIVSGLKIVEQAQRAAAPVGPPGRKNSKGQAITPGQVKRSINYRFKRSRGKNSGWITAKSGMNVGLAKDSPMRAYHYHFVALGTNPRWAGIKYDYTKRVKGKRSQYIGQKFSDKIHGKNLGGKARYTGVMPANDFIARATASVEGQAIQATREKILQEIEREAVKLK